VAAIAWALVVAAAGISQEISLEEYQGPGPRGDVYGTATTVTNVVVRDLRRRVRGATGDLVQSTRTIYCPPDTGGATGSRVTYAGVTSTVLQRTYHDGGGAHTPDHVELALQ
jgi:hypothetical protein